MVIGTLRSVASTISAQDGETVEVCVIKKPTTRRGKSATFNVGETVVILAQEEYHKILHKKRSPMPFANYEEF